MRFQQSGLQIREQLLHGEQRTNFIGVEPQPGQLETRRIDERRIKPLAARFTIPHHRRMESVAHVFKIALEGRKRDAQFVQELVHAHRTLAFEQLLDFVKAF